MSAAVWDGTGEPVYNIPVALSIMVFFALCAQCASTLVVIRRENEQLALAGVHVRLHDGAGLRGRTGDLSNRHAAAADLKQRANRAQSKDHGFQLAESSRAADRGSGGRLSWRPGLAKLGAASGGVVRRMREVARAGPRSRSPR